MHERIEPRSSAQMNMPHRNRSSQPHALLRDADLAKRKLATEELSLAIVKRGKAMFTSRASGVRSLIEAIKECGSALAGAAVADKVVGRAAALVCVYAKISSVYACVMSELGLEVLKKFSIPFEHDTVVPNILDRHGTEMCPFERLVLKTGSPKEAFLAIDRYLAIRVSQEV